MSGLLCSPAVRESSGTRAMREMWVKKKNNGSPAIRGHVFRKNATEAQSMVNLMRTQAKRTDADRARQTVMKGVHGAQAKSNVGAGADMTCGRVHTRARRECMRYCSPTPTWRADTRQASGKRRASLRATKCLISSITCDIR